MNRTETQTSRVNGVDIHVETEGTGEPLLLLHGFMGSSQDWAHAGSELLAQRFRLIRVDARGHGRSTNPSRRLTHRQCALDTLALLDQLGPRT